MKYIIETWPIEKLLKIYEEKKLNLNPPYQRNDIWSASAQKKLVDTIKRGQPMPNFFLLRKSNGKFEMVDGQQRTRTIVGCRNGDISDSEGRFYDDALAFLEYKLNICIISDMQSDEFIEKFYALVNKSGLRLNRPEVMKADYYDTLFQKLITSLAMTQEFAGLQLFSETSQGRMNDIEFVSELVALLKYGITEKKDKVDIMYEEDITKAEYEKFHALFQEILGHILRFNKIRPINETRYKQKNDFYSLFAFLLKAKKLKTSTLDYYYKILLRIEPGISPSQNKCEPLMNYAVNCVTQSNSKKARDARHRFFVELFLNEDTKPNKIQKEILKFFKLDESRIIIQQGKITLKKSALPTIV